MTKNLLAKKVTTAVASLALVGGICLADDIKRDLFEERIPIPAEEVPVEVPVNECGGFKGGVSVGLANFFFDRESTRPAPGLYLDGRSDCTPVNFRLGVEGRHMDLEQAEADAAAEFPGKATEITFIRIPLSVEYMQAINDDLTWFAGVGPDLIRTANDVSDTSVGMHVSSRIAYNITDMVNVGLEAGYLWAKVDGPAQDISLDSAFVTPTIGIQF